MSERPESTFRRLRERALETVQAGRLREGLAQLEEALAEARGAGEEAEADRALCGRAAVLVELGEGAEVKPELRRILLKRADPESGFLAAYTLARAYDVEGDGEKALFYARIANRQAETSGIGEHLSASHNQIGNLLLTQSDFESALHEFHRALELLPPARSVRRAIALDNLGYCHAIRGRFRKAFRHLFESVRTCRALGARAIEASSRLSLAFAYLQCGRYGAAIRHAARSLALAEACEDQMTVKYGLFVLGEAEKMSGNPLAARHHFCRLQRDFYPEAPNVPDLLLLLNVQNLVNIKAGGGL
jgi:tetratricopeptide (TPR) repeat protein